MDRKIGKTGLTQKDAVFEIVKGVLGAGYNPKVSVESMIAHKSDGYVKPQWHSTMLDQGIGKSKRKSKSFLWQGAEYSGMPWILCGVQEYILRLMGKLMGW